MKTIKLTPRTYSDTTYVEGVFNRNAELEHALYKHCKRYFDENYRSIFFVEEEYKEEIFQETFITLWRHIEERRLSVEEGILMGRDKSPLKCSLTTYMMGIARLKYLEWVRQNPQAVDEDLEKEWNKDSYGDILYGEEENAILEIIAECVSQMSEGCNKILTLFYYQEKRLDDMLLEIPTYSSKDALKTAKYKCLTNMKKCIENRKQSIYA